MICPQCGTQGVPGTPYCTRCGHSLAESAPAATQSSQWAPSWSAPPVAVQPEIEYVAYGAIEFVSPLPNGQAQVLQAPQRPPTFVERVLGGNWLSALIVAAPAFAAAVVAAALAQTSQLLINSEADRIPIYLGNFRSTGAWFHGIPQLVAMGFGSPTYLAPGGSARLSFSAPPLLIPTLAVVVFVYLLKRRIPGESVPERLAFALRAALMVVALLVIMSCAGSWSTSEYGDHLHLSVSPGRVLGWSALLFVTAAVLVAVRPLDLLERHAERFVAADWRPAVRGAVVTTATAVALGFVTVVGAAFAQWHNKADVARLLPSALGNSVNLGIYGWHVSMLGTLRDTTSGGHESLSLVDHHTLSLFYYAMLALPVLSIAAGALYLRRAFPLIDTQTLHRSCYRMSLGVVALYVALAIPSEVRTEYGGPAAALGSGRFGPQVQLGALFVLAWYLLGGYAVGRLVARGPRVVAASELAPVGPVAGDPDELAIAPAPRRRRVLTPITIGVACAVLLAAGAAGATITHGGKHAPLGLDAAPPSYAFTAPAQGGDVIQVPSGQLGSGQFGDTATEDQDAQQTLNDLAAAEQDYYSQNGIYTNDDTQLDTYSPPGDVNVTIDYADDTRFCADAIGIDSSNDYTYDSDLGQVQEGGNC